MSSQILHSFTIIKPFQFFIVVCIIANIIIVTAAGDNRTLNYELHNSTRKIEKNVTLEDDVLIKRPIEETGQPAESLNSWENKNSSSNENAINIENNNNSNSNLTESTEGAGHGNGNDDINDRLSEKAEKQKETDQGRPSNAFRRLLCEFLIFLVIAAIFCIISSCNCFCHKKRNSTNNSSEEYEINLAEEANLKRLCKIEEPFAPNKPYCLRLDQQGNWHASPLAPELVPPLPSYGEACKMPTPSEQERTIILPI